MDEREVLEFLKAQKKAVLLDYLESALQSMTGRQRRDVFGDAVLKPKTKKAVDGDKLLKEISLFHRDLVKRTMEVAKTGDHERAVSCFAMLHELFKAVDRGDEIFVAEEAGSWMIPIDEKAWLKAYKRQQALLQAQTERKSTHSD